MKHFTSPIKLLLVVIFVFANYGFSQEKKPNVIIIMTDDMGNNIEALGNPWLKTPNMNKLKSESVYLSNFHQALMCTPSRAGIMTGRYALRTGAWRTSVGRSNMRPEETTIAEVFKANGYATGQFGKWHLGDTWPYTSNDQGFEETVNLKCGGIGQISDYWGNDYFDDTYYHNGVPTKYKGYCTNVFFDETIRFIKECNQKETPFLIYLAPNVAHLPRIVGEAYSKPFIDKGHDKNQAYFYGMITNFDENLGRLQSMLKSQGIDDDTIIVFTTDDGTAGYAAQFDKEARALDTGFNMGQRGGKGSPYEGGHRLFSFVKWNGGKINQGETVDQMTSVLDIFPTLMDLCEVNFSKPLDLDGVSLKPALYGNEIQGNSERSLFLTKLNPDKPNDFKRNKLCVVKGKWRWIDKKELYNIDDDRGQFKNVADSYPEIVKLLDSELDNFLKQYAKDREDPVRFVLGDSSHKTIGLTTQDLWIKSAFNQSHVKNLSEGKGPWKVDFRTDSEYEFTLSRYPLYTGLAFSAKTNGKKSKTFTPTKAKLKIGNNEYEKLIPPNSNSISFKCHVKAQEADIETWIYSKEGITIPSYYLTINKL